jgi:ComF family protein
VRLLKYSGLRAAVSDMAGAIAERVAFPSSASVLLVPVPTASSRVRQRGYDQAVLLAKALARQADFPYASLLLRSGQQRQVGASRRQREAQLASAFVVRRAKKIEGARVILVDDVKTTGATLEAAALALKQAGAKSVEAAVFAQA